MVSSQSLCYRYVEHIKFDTCVKFHDHQSMNNKSMVVAVAVAVRGKVMVPPLKLRFPKKPMSNRLTTFDLINMVI